MSEECIYFTEQKGTEVHDCQLYERCKRTNGTNEIVGCDTCRDRLYLSSKNFISKWKDQLEVTDRRRHKTEVLRNLIAGRSAFLVCGGPSGKPYLPQMNRRGVFSLSVNNVAGNIHRPSAFVCSDPPRKFSHSIWLDPGIMKFIPSPKIHRNRGRLAEKHDGVFFKSDMTVENCPNVWGFRRESWMEPNETFFTSSGACWGNLNAGVEKTGLDKTVCTMLLGIRLLSYLGAKRIFLIGVDFRMSPDSGYSFNQERTAGASSSNNAQFSVVNGWLCEMQRKSVFARFGLDIFNCFEESGLRAFPYIPFSDALEDVCNNVEETPDLSDWYEKASCKMCGSWHVKITDSVITCLDCNHSWQKEN